MLWASLVAQKVRCLLAMWVTRVWSLGQEDPLEKEMAIHSSTFAWKIPLTEEPGRVSWGCKELDMTKQLHFLSFFLFFFRCHWKVFKNHLLSPITLGGKRTEGGASCLLKEARDGRREGEEVEVTPTSLVGRFWRFTEWRKSYETAEIQREQGQSETRSEPLSSLNFTSVQSLSRVWLCNPMNCSTPGLPVHHKLPEFTQTHVHQVSDTIQPSHPLSSPSPPAPNPSQHQGLFQWANSSHEVAKVLEFQLQHQSFQWTPRTDLL